MLLRLITFSACALSAVAQYDPNPKQYPYPYPVANRDQCPSGHPVNNGKPIYLTETFYSVNPTTTVVWVPTTTVIPVVETETSVSIKVEMVHFPSAPPIVFINTTVSATPTLTVYLDTTTTNYNFTTTTTTKVETQYIPVDGPAHCVIEGDRPERPGLPSDKDDLCRQPIKTPAPGKPDDTPPRDPPSYGYQDPYAGKYDNDDPEAD